MASSPPGHERFHLLVQSVRDYGIFLLDPMGTVVSWNRGAEHIKGYRADEIIGRHFSIFYPPEAIARGWPEQELAIAGQEGRFEDEGWRLRKDGSRFWANVVITALRDEEGTLQGFAKVTRDLTERRAQEESLRQSEERFRLLVEGVKDYAIFMLDPEGRVASWNGGATSIKGYQAQEVLGQHFSLFYPPEDIARGWPEHELEVALRVGRFEDEGWRIRKDGSRFWANVVITPLYDGEQRLHGFAKVTRDMTDRKRMEALEESNTQKNEFLAMLSHELRNPLAPIRNALEVMLEKSSGEPVIEWGRAMIERQVGHLTRLVDDLLEVSRIMTHKITLRKEPVEIAEIVSGAAEASRPLIDSHGHTLEVELPDEPLRVEGDSTRLSQALLNLLNNAAKYTPEGGSIWLTVEREGGQVILRVRDTGIGIPAELLPKVFDLFLQGERTLDRSEGGLGIGLTLVQQITLLHNGSVQAWSEGAGRGTEIILRLPLFSEAKAEDPQQAGPRDAPPAQSARRVLVVDDNHDAAASLEMLVQLWGHEVRTAHTGPAALAEAVSYQPEVVLLDIGLPGMDGYEVAQRLRELDGLDRVVLVAITGYGQEDDRRRSREAGFDQHLVKPVDPMQLQEVLAAVDSVDPAFAHE